MKINKRSILTGMSMFLILMLTYCKKDPETTQTTNEVKYDATLYNFQPGLSQCLISETTHLLWRA